MNFNQVNYPKGKTIVDLFEEQVERTPDNIAIKFKEKELTYSELNEKANQLAYYLISKFQIRPDQLIGLELEKSEKVIISILAIATLIFIVFIFIKFINNFVYNFIYCY